MTDKPAHRRVLLKLSGESFIRPDRMGISVREVESIADQVLAVRAEGIEPAVVVGGGNLVRGSEFAARGTNRVTADYMGMLATVINGMALQDALERKGCDTRLMTAISMAEVAEPFIRRRALRHLEKGRVVILAGGTGNPYMTTDTTAALRAAELGADVLLKATKVDGVYTADPATDPDAEKIDELSYLDVLSGELGVMDATAVTLCKENDLPIVVFSMKVDGNILRAVKGERIGTRIVREDLKDS